MDEQNVVVSENQVEAQVETPKKTRKPRVGKKLTQHFFKAPFRAQIASLWRAWVKKDEKKIEEYKAVLAQGLCKIEGPLTKTEMKKFENMGIVLPEGIEVKPRKSRIRKEKVEVPVETAPVVEAPKVQEVSN